MMKYIITQFLLLFFISNLTFSQANLYSANFYLAAAYANQAELSICYNNLENAELFYDSLFNIMPNPSGKDTWNRALLSKHMGNKVLEDSLVRLLFYKGYDLEKIANCFDTLILSSLITPEYRKIRKQHTTFVNDIMRDDQRVNQDKAIDPDNWIKTWLSNIVKVMSYTNSVDSLNIPYFTLESSKLNICITHYFQLWSNSKALNYKGFAKTHPYMRGLSEINFESNGLITFLIEQVEKGHYSEDMLAYNLSISKYPFSYNIVEQYDSLVFVKEPVMIKNIGGLDSLNNKRKFLGLENYEQYFLKAQFIDSLYFEGNVFKPIPKDKITEYFNTISRKCVYNMVGNYRKTMFMKYPNDAIRAINELKEKYGVE